MNVVDMRGARSRCGTRRSTRGAQRAAQALALHQRGDDLDTIARTLGYVDRSGARKAVQRGRANCLLASDEELRCRELERLEVIARRVLPLVDCASPDLRAAELLLRVGDRRVKLLGLDGKRPEVPTDPDGRVAEELVRDVNEYIALADKMLTGVAASGIGSGVYRGGSDDDEDPDISQPLLGTDPPAGEATDRGADHTDSDDDDSYDREFDDELGEWKDGKFIRRLDLPADGDDALPDRACHRLSVSADGLAIR